MFCVFADVEILTGSCLGVLGYCLKLHPKCEEGYTSQCVCKGVGLFTLINMTSLFVLALSFPIHYAETVQCGGVTNGGMVALYGR